MDVPASAWQDVLCLSLMSPHRPGRMYLAFHGCPRIGLAGFTLPFMDVSASAWQDVLGLSLMSPHRPSRMARRRIAENVFDIVAQRYRVLRKRVILQRGTAEKVVLACCVLHNFLMCRRGRQYLHAASADNESYVIISGDWQEEGIPESSWYPLRRGTSSSISQQEIR
ncbi:hypothetical protein PR048_022521 [Dryococelus australis]|uniref:DDE Tnp4 domain-containing protein n=1 Tax=Dryococelus australis TaxID=614101 RepID=A0ABQ9H195_9NEOP|nr:hypothetical protein PR048_022521 [Dryococelus australis]